MKSKALYITLISVLSAIALSIITCCIVFSFQKSEQCVEGIGISQDQNSTDGVNYDVSDFCKNYIFNYGDRIKINLGDSFSLAPQNQFEIEDGFITYSTDSENIVSISSEGILTANRCGKAIVKVFNHNVEILSTEVDVNFICDIVPVSGCELYHNGLRLSSNTASFKISFVNSKGESYLLPSQQEVKTSEGIKLILKMDKYILTASNNGQIDICFSDSGVQINIPIVFN